jgi:hypothetical protein
MVVNDGMRNRNLLGFNANLPALWCLTNCSGFLPRGTMDHGQRQATVYPCFTELHPPTLLVQCSRANIASILAPDQISDRHDLNSTECCIELL